MSVEGREFRWSLEIWGAHGCTRAPFSNQKRLIFWIEAPIVGSLIFEPSTDWSEGEHNWWRILEKARSPNPFWTHPRLSCSFPQRAMQAGARKVDTLHFHYIGLREKLQESGKSWGFCPHCPFFLQRFPSTNSGDASSIGQELKLFRDANRVMSEEVRGAARGEFHQGNGNRDLGRVCENGRFYLQNDNIKSKPAMGQACQPPETTERWDWFVWTKLVPKLALSTAMNKPREQTTLLSWKTILI